MSRVSDPPDVRFGTIGTAVPGAAVRVSDEGELLVRTAALCDGYAEGRDAAEAFVVDGDGRWLRTGDQAVVRPDGRIELAGRLSEVIIRGGRNIDPSAVEHVLESHPAVDGAFVFGVPSRVAGEEDVCAVVAASPGTTAEELRRHCLGTLDAMLVPARLTVVAELPRTPDGSVRRAEARAAFARASS
jgi:acyl-CoA synthetase (AMP-forming)/AMP-acid ligase II